MKMLSTACAHPSNDVFGCVGFEGWLVIAWLEDRTLAEEALKEVGIDLLAHAAASLFVNPVRRYIAGIPKRYKAFRRQRQDDGHWYTKERIPSAHIHPLELDVVLLAILRSSGSLLARPNIIAKLEDPIWSALRPVHDLYKSQVLVDEATDFSPVQLACMAALSHPRIRSFFACGDFNQRLTTWGSRSVEDVRWVLSDIDIREINVSYRQSRRLAEFANAVVVATGGSSKPPLLPDYLENEGVAPALLEQSPERRVVISWLADRIREIERFVGELPSIAVFVEDETQVQLIATDLNDAMSEENARVVACANGQAVGRDNDIRVFDIQHIKGLEFEAVFFVGVDRLADNSPHLFDKYLYVGATRAATYLGITCDGELPESLAGLRPMLVSDWKSS